MMKCPWNDWKDCYKYDCPFYGVTAKKPRYEGGYNYVELPICRRAQIEEAAIRNGDGSAKKTI